MEAPKFLKKLLGLRDPQRAANLVAQGVASARDHDVNAALALYRQAISADDTYALAHLNVALALQDLYNERRAELAPDEQHTALAEMSVHLKTALRLDERLIPGLRALGYVERAQGHFDEAKAAFEHYLDLSDPKDPQRERVQNMLAEVAERAALETALAAAVAVAEHVHDSDATARTEAESQVLGVLEKEPQRAEAWWALGVLRRAAKDPRAREHLETALKADPYCTVAHKELASLHFHGGQPDLALPHARAAYESDPTNAALVCNVGVCHLATGDLKEARDFLLIAKGLAPKDPIVLDAFKALDDATKAPRR